MRRGLFPLSETDLLALAIFRTRAAPDLFLIPSMVWRTPDECFVSRDFRSGRKSEPEWGVEARPKHIESRLVEFAFDEQVRRLTAAVTSRCRRRPDTARARGKWLGGAGSRRGENTPEQSTMEKMVTS